MVALLLVAAIVVGYAALVGLDSPVLPERMGYFQRATSVTSASTARSPTGELSSRGGSNASEEIMMNQINASSTNATISSEDRSTLAAQGALVSIDAADQKADVSKPQDSTSTAVSESDAKVLTAKGLSESTPASEQRSKEPEATKESEPTITYDLDELMTPELIHKIGTQENNCLSPIQVHLIWVGDTNKAPNHRFKYTAKGYNLTVHTSPEEILDGFHPHVLRAYYQAIPTVVGFDFLRFAILYKYGGFAVDAGTPPAIPAAEIKWPSDCDVIFGKEVVHFGEWEKPVFRQHGGLTYGLIRPFQILNWAMAISKPRNYHTKWMLQTAMMHFFGLRDMNLDLVQDISGSGLMTDYVALLHEREGRSIKDVYNDHTRYFPAQGLCLTDSHMRGTWIDHHFFNSWGSLDTTDFRLEVRRPLSPSGFNGRVSLDDNPQDSNLEVLATVISTESLSISFPNILAATPGPPHATKRWKNGDSMLPEDHHARCAYRLPPLHGSDAVRVISLPQARGASPTGSFDNASKRVQPRRVHDSQNDPQN